MAEKKKKTDKSKLEGKLDKVAKALERSNVSEYVQLLQRPMRMIGVNLLAGIARGLGIAIGMTLITALVINLMTKVLKTG